MEIQRELGVDRFDLPHGYAEKAGVCECGRSANDELHQPMTTEKATETSLLQTEKGS
jgi:hypothetical protein